MTGSQTQVPGLDDIDLDRARWHVAHGTKQFCEFLGSGSNDLTAGFARWLKDRHQGTFMTLAAGRTPVH